MADELLDLVDKNDNVIGTVWKSEAHGNPELIHREVAIAIFNKKKETLLQQRSLKKVNDPGEWKIAAAGHVGAGEDPKVAIKREVFEELGFYVKPTFYKKVFRKNITKGKIPEARFFYIYYVLVDDNPEIKLDLEEVSDIKWVNINSLENFSKNNKYELDSLSHKTIIEVDKMLKII